MPHCRRGDVDQSAPSFWALDLAQDPRKGDERMIKENDGVILDQGEY